KRFPILMGELPDLPAESAEEGCIRNLDRLERIQRLAELDETDRKLLLAFSLAEKPTKQIAREMQLTDGQVRVRLHRIRRRLRKGLKNDG
ncbi:MAG: hypothetical protein IJ174_01035, partial [Clostridia bacterium]|nr:hypothetical protein [Clostridia bacterium]